jgi:hypothetical protein
MSLKPESSADHTADTGAAARPAAADLTFGPYISVWTADSHATSAVIALVIGVERAGDAGGGGAGIGVGDTDSLHRSERTKNERSE